MKGDVEADAVVTGVLTRRHSNFFEWNSYV
jgi:hypothetical protein